MNKWKTICLNCGERYQDMIDHRSYWHNLSSFEIKAWKKKTALNSDTGIAEVMGSNPVQAWIFSGFNFATVAWITAMINHISWYLSPQIKYMVFHIFICKRLIIQKTHQWKRQSVTVFRARAILGNASILGNALVLAAIIRTPSIRSTHMIMLCSLAVSDFLVGLFAFNKSLSKRLDVN